MENNIIKIVDGDGLNLIFLQNYSIKMNFNVLRKKIIEEVITKKYKDAENGKLWMKTKNAISNLSARLHKNVQFPPNFRKITFFLISFC